MMIEFEGYGKLEYLEPEDFWAGPWTILETPVSANDGQKYDIVRNIKTNEIRCTNI